MVKFFNREREMAELDAFLVGRVSDADAQLVGVYGRRRLYRPSTRSGQATVVGGQDHSADNLGCTNSAFSTGSPSATRSRR